MKKDIHPKTQDCQVTCACGASFNVLSKDESMKIDLCSSCHPFFTGESKLVDIAGRVDKFKKKYNL
jgi:large subunit ribosomal protein L31